ncbi:DUF4386 domain-containing protein [Spirosoma sp. BT702]|uniref:DUF4386 domain-containing protein n=1 Tax=Spirosoma profusum TaxID=2771354 RepID=A0A926XVM7_9BACT|nr:DUF4386 domain-containing protein [Spirosoma profusum]MBD2701347.1 DUF4386 domain-containing protein [Spirosoma profusum]
MTSSSIPSNRLIGFLLILGAVLVLIPYTLLTITFNYPLVLREEPGQVLTQFHAGGSTLIFTWLAFALSGFPLLIAYVLIGQRFENQVYFVRLATTLGVTSGLVQIVGLLRWTFVVPVLATNYVNTTDPAIRAASVAAFQTIHQFGGVLLGEHLGQLLTIAWTILIARTFAQLALFPSWVSWFGYVASAIYLMAQGDLLATVIPGFPAWDLAGLLGSTFWLVWLVTVGVQFLRLNRLDNVLASV